MPDEPIVKPVARDAVKYRLRLAVPFIFVGHTKNKSNPLLTAHSAAVELPIKSRVVIRPALEISKIICREGGKDQGF